jgi:type I restriction-modification system DNA methylase subunit
MNPELARKTIVETFRQKFDDARFLYFIRNLVNHLDESKKQTWTLKKAAFEDFVNHFTRLGTYTDADGEAVDVLVIHLRKDTTLARGRVTLRNFVADYLATGHGQGKAAVMAAFVSPTEDDWRFSFVKLDYTFEKTDLGFVAERIQLTPARRYSYLVGKNENCHTAQKQFLALLETHEINPTVAQLEAAFSVEKVTREFYDHYKDLFEQTRDALAAFLDSAPKIKTHFAERGIECDDFAKKLLGQIVFLYFLQKKGWFGVERGKTWGSGRKDFIRHLFNNRADYAHIPGQRKRPANFFNDILEPLFYEAIAAPRTDEDHYYSRFDCKIPFLNGGLFEPLYGYNWVETEILLPDTLFANDKPSQEKGETGTGILDVFDRYNFTVNEAEPLEKEVAVDPEMLGLVFENLLPENVRHSSGTFYTPRVIVHYMCQQALLHYLTVRAADIPQADLALFLRLAERFTDFQAKETKKHADKRLPDSIRNNAARLDELLATIAVCDPAIGSGAFPVGMMLEICRARMALAAVEGMPEQTFYHLKRHAIQHSLYGVDLDPGAVEIAKLRLWLSMVVDEDNITDIQPLPNLDYKIMQGNSLLEEFDGVRLLDDKLLQPPAASRESEIADLKNRISAASQEFVRLHGEGKKSAAAKLATEQEIKRLKKQLAGLVHPDEAKPDGQGELNQQTSWASLKRIQELHSTFFDEDSRAEKDKLRRELDGLEWNFMEATLRESGREAALAELKRASATHRKPFFLWRLHFGEVFQKRGGFDVVMANPPYVRADEQSEEFQAQRKSILNCGDYETLWEKWDLYVAFIERGFKMLRQDGVSTMIVSDAFCHSKYAQKAQKWFLQNSSILRLDFCGDLQIFDAAVHNLIFLFQRSVGANHKPERHVHHETFGNVTVLPSDEQAKLTHRVFFPEDRVADTFNCKSVKLGDVCYISVGMVVHADEKVAKGAFELEDLVADSRDAKHPCRFVEGKHLSRWLPYETKWLEWGTSRAPDLFRRPTFSQLYAVPEKIFIHRTAGEGLRSCYDSEQTLCNHTVIVSLPWHALHGVRNKSLKKSARYRDEKPPRPDLPKREELEEISRRFAVKYLLGVMNSSAARNFLRSNRRSNTDLYPDDWKQLPIPDVSPEKQKPAERLVERILAAKAQDADADVSALEQEIDDLVYALYALTPDEAKLVEDAQSEKHQPVIAEPTLPKGKRVTLGGVKYAIQLVQSLLTESADGLTWPRLVDAFTLATQPSLMAQEAASADAAKILAWSKRWNEILPPGALLTAIEQLGADNLAVTKSGNTWHISLKTARPKTSAEDVNYDAWLALRTLGPAPEIQLAAPVFANPNFAVWTQTIEALAA